MKEKIELRINSEFAHLLFKPNEGRNIGSSIKIVKLDTRDSRIRQIKSIAEKIEVKYDKAFYFGWKVVRKYSSNELKSTTHFQIKVKSTFEPTGAECGTVYDETIACKICGSGRQQVTPLYLKKGSIPQKDISKTIAGEIIVSEKFVNSYNQHALEGLEFKTVLINNKESNWFQVTTNKIVELSDQTLAGIDPFDLSTSNEGEVYKCPKGHTIGLNILSEVYIKDHKILTQFDFFASKQEIGVKRGLLRPTPIYVCSAKFRNMIVENKLTGFDFEIAHIV